MLMLVGTIAAFLGLSALALAGWPAFLVALSSVALVLIGLGSAAYLRPTSRLRRVEVSSAAITWGGRTVRSDRITSARIEGRKVVLEADGHVYRLEPLGGPELLLNAIHEAKRRARALGTADEVPNELRGVAARVAEG